MFKYLLLLLFAAIPILAQTNSQTVFVTVAPSGACTARANLRLLVPNGSLYTCQNGTWAVISGGGGTGCVPPSTNNLVKGDGVGGCSDSGILPANVVTLVGVQTLTNKTVDGVSPTTFGFLDATSSIQTQLNAKQASLGYTAANAALSNLASVSINTALIPQANIDLGSSGNPFRAVYANSFIGTGSGSSYLSLPQTSPPSQGTTAIQLMAPVSVTSYQIVLPGTSTTGFWLGTNSSNVDTLTFVPTIGVTNGGTGATTFTAHGPLIGEGTGAIVAASPGTTGQCYLSNGASVDASFQACPGGAGAGNSVTSTTPVTVNTNTTSDQQLMELSLGAGYFNSSKQPFLFDGAGVYTTQTAQTPTITLKIKLCTVSGCGSGTVVTLISIVSTATIAAVTNNNWNLAILGYTATTGATGNLEIHGPLAVDLGALTTTADSVFVDTNTAVSSNIDLTAALFVDFTIAFSTNAATANTFTQRSGGVMPFAATSAPVTSVNTKTGVVALTLNSSDFANEGTTTTLLHGNAAGNPSFASVSLTADVSGVLPTANIALALANQTSLHGITAGTAAGNATLGQVIASGATAVDFTSTATGACATVITATATGAASTDVIIFNANASIKAVTGYVPASTGGFSISAFPTTNSVSFEGCNWTAGTVDPGSITINWVVIR